MAFSGHYLYVFAMVAIAWCSWCLPTHSQISIPCTELAVSNFTPCMNFLTNSSSTTTTSLGLGSPTSLIANCCDSLKTLTITGMDCLCFILAGNSPIQIPLAQHLAITLPSDCNASAVPVQCQASVAASPIPGFDVSGPIASMFPPESAAGLAPASDLAPRRLPKTNPIQITNLLLHFLRYLHQFILR